MKDNSIVPSDLTETQILVLILVAHLHDYNPHYLSEIALDAVVESSERLNPELTKLDKNLTVNDLIISVLSKDKFH